MAKVYVMIADGTEEVECLAVLDILKRAGMDVILVAAKDSKNVITSHHVRIEADGIAAEIDFSDADAIFVPGGMPGSEHLSNCEPLIAALHQADRESRRIAAICAAPAVVLGRHGFLAGRTATCYPGFESELNGAAYTSQGVITDGNITTARGVGFAIDLGLELVRLLVDDEAAANIKKQIQHNCI